MAETPKTTPDSDSDTVTDTTDTAVPDTAITDTDTTDTAISDVVDVAVGDDPLAHRPRTARKVAIGVGVVLVGLIALFAIGPGDRADEASDLLGRRVPAVAGPTLDGGSYDIDNARGRWVVVNFFASWCPGCIAEHPELVAFDQWGEETGRAEVVAVVFNDPAENVAAFFAEQGGSWPVLDEPSLPVQFQVAQIPESFLVSPTGQVVYHVQGEVDAQALIDVIESAP